MSFSQLIHRFTCKWLLKGEWLWLPSACTYHANVMLSDTYEPRHTHTHKKNIPGLRNRNRKAIKKKKKKKKSWRSFADRFSLLPPLCCYQQNKALINDTAFLAFFYTPFNYEAKVFHPACWSSPSASHSLHRFSSGFHLHTTAANPNIYFKPKSRGHSSLMQNTRWRVASQSVPGQQCIFLYFACASFNCPSQKWLFLV